MPGNPELETNIFESIRSVRELAALSLTAGTLGGLVLSASNTEKAIANDENCTTIRDDKDGRYMGLACASNGDTFAAVGEQRHHDRPYGVFFIKKDGVYKCGYSNEVLPEIENAREDVSSFCVDKQDDLDIRSAHFEDNNCPLIENTQRDSCNDGTFGSKIAKICKGVKKRMYANFATASRSVLNVLGKNVAFPFSMVRSKNDSVDKVHYRFQFKDSGEYDNRKIDGIVVRTDDTEGKLGWGYMRDECVPTNKRLGGPQVKD